MTLWGHFRLLALLTTVGLVYILLFSKYLEPRKGAYIFFCFVDIFLFSHYILAFSTQKVRQQTKELVKISRTRWTLIILGVLTLLAALYEPESAMLFFGFHFALSEVYSRFAFDHDANFYTKNTTLFRVFRASHFLFLLSGYFLATYHILDYALKIEFVKFILPKSFLDYSTLSLAVFYFSILTFYHKKLFPQQRSNETLLSYALPDLFFIPIFFLASLYKISWSAFVLYHIIFWFYFPLIKVKSLNDFKIINYKHIMPTILICLYFLWRYPNYLEGTPSNAAFLDSMNYNKDVIYPFAGFFNDVSNQETITTYKITMSWGIFHILFSIALSALNPKFIRTFFSPKKTDPLVR